MFRERYRRQYGMTAREIVMLALNYMKRDGYQKFTYNDVAKYVYSLGFRIKLETIKRLIRRFVEEDILEDAGFFNRQRYFKFK